MTVVTIGGPPGAGTTTVSKLASAKLRLEFVYAGGLFRQLAADRNMTLEDFIGFADKNPKIDHELDARMIKLAQGGGVLVEGRVSAFLMRREGISAFKVHIGARPDVRARRVAERDGGDPSDARRAIDARERKERKRFIALYGFDLRDMSVYDLVLDSSERAPDDICDDIVKGVAARAGAR